MCTFLRLEDCLRSLSTTYHFTHVRALVSEIGRQLNLHTFNNEYGMLLVHLMNECMCVWSACIRTEWISVVNALSLPPTQCLMMSLTPSYTHTHTHTHTHTLSQGYYDAIKAEPFQYHQGGDELTEVFFNPDHQGWLIKEGTWELIPNSSPATCCMQVQFSCLVSCLTSA